MSSSGKRGKKPTQQVESLCASKKVEPLRPRADKQGISGQALRQSWDDWERTFNAAADLIMLVDSEFKIVRANAATLRFLGKSMEDVLGRTCCELIHDSDEPPEVCPLRRAMRTKQHEEAELYVALKKAWITVSVDPVLDDRGNVVRAVHIVRDITGYKRAEESLRESEERFASFMNNSPTISWMKDEEGRHVYLSKTYEVRFGVKLEECRGKTDFELWPQKTAKEFRKNDLAVLKSWRPLEVIEETSAPDGRRSYWLNFKFPFKDASGKKYVGGIGVDVTERKKAEEEIERLARFLAENPNPVLRISDGGIILYSNEASAPLLEAWQCGTGQRLPEHWHEFVLVSLNRRQVQETEVECGGSIYSLKFAPVSSGKYVNVYGLDITERKAAEVKLLEYQKWLKSLASELSLAEEHERRRLAKGMHDQIGQKLALAKLTLRSLMESVSEPNVLASLGAISDELNDVIEETHLLTFELSNPILYELGLEKAVEKCLAEQIEGKHGIKCKFISEAETLKLDEQSRGILFQDIQELLANVVKHANAKTVEVRIEQAGGMVQVTVRDDGVGFDPSKIYASMREGQTGGFGLFGIRERLEYLGGGMQIESAPGQGSCIMLSLPLKRKGTK
jgi:PAS domain S-box-containing protein